MSSQYEVEHGIKASDAPPRRRRQLDMSTFNAHVRQIIPEGDGGDSTPHNNPHATATPFDLSLMFRLVQEQLGTLASDSPSEENRRLLRSMMELLNDDIEHPPYDVRGVSQQFLDGLDRVPRKGLKAEDACPICAECFLDDPYPLVVELPCHSTHRFDLECVAPWLQSKDTCPLCREAMEKRKEQPPKEATKDDEDEGEEFDDFYA